MLVETLRADWTARGTNARVHALPEFENGALTLGAGTKLAEAHSDRRDEATEGERAVALVSVAIGRPLGASAATHVRSALSRAREGDAPLALTHLALAGAGRLDDPPEDARRLFIADGLMKAGVSPRTILAALGADAPAPADLDRAYNPDQPRVPAGNGRPSGQWTSGDYANGAAADDAASSPSARNDAASDGPRGVQIADDSDDWPQDLDPISSAEAAETGRPPFNGSGPNAQHQLGVDAAIAHYQALGYKIFSSTATAVDVPGFLTPRVYDFVVQSPTGILIGVEVKTTLNDTIFLNPTQVVKDVLLMLNGGGDARASGASIQGVAYTTFCRSCDAIDIRSVVLYGLLKFAKVPFWHDRLP